MILSNAIALAMGALPLVLAGGNTCISQEGSQCQWTSCLDRSKPGPEYHDITTTHGSSHAKVCAADHKNYPGPDCCRKYGNGCWFGGSTLWCQPVPEKPLEMPDPFIGTEWLRFNQEKNKQCDGAGGSPRNILAPNEKVAAVAYIHQYKCYGKKESGGTRLRKVFGGNGDWVEIRAGRRIN
ncbi:hypothetical protein CDD81_1741 [Ophiocordyceps australis]|uniref:Uncharacterized protein n=1 Tax=Ophiocordyceps australis TaxID=1399860 RepID=A0A2C5Y840_9HYPO|nr:hypothetical protein CDD81_1741 [Ophiocordyceps australis]